jgi:glycosyltransferase involved in cell wall biosynthesis
MAWRKGMVALSALPGDQSKWLTRLAVSFPPLVKIDEAIEQLYPTDYDVVHAFNLSWEYPAIVGWQFARTNKLPFVVTPFAHLNAVGRNPAGRMVTMDHQKALLADADAVLTLTEAAILGLAQLGVKCRHSLPVGGGLDPIPPLKNSKKLLSRFQLNPPYAIFVGRANADKGALDAARAVLSTKGGLGLVVVGSRTPEFDNFYERLSAPQKVRVRHVGKVTEAEKHTLLSMATMLLLPSRTDALGIVLLEAWAHAIPVIGANVGGIPFVIEDGVDGLLVPYGDVPALSNAIQHLMANPRERTLLGKAGQKKVGSQYTWKQVGKRVLDAYEYVLGNQVA